MSFQIVEILEPRPDRILARVKHGNHEFPAMIFNRDVERLTAGETFQAKISYDEILTWNVINDFNDRESGIRQEEDGIHLLGRVHNVLDYGDGKTILDVYMQNGSEFFTLDSETIDDIPEANDGLEITVGNLYVYPDER